VTNEHLPTATGRSFFPYPEIVSMKKLFVFALVAITASSLFTAGAKRSEARPNYWTEFVKLYVPAEDAADPADKAKSTTFRTAKCNVCHIGTTNKKTRNAFGIATDLPKLEKSTDKIIAGLKKAADTHSVKGDDKSPTYGDLIKEGKLPVEAK
jgi:hypothetical protein